MRLWATCQRFVSQRNPSWRHNFRSVLVFFPFNKKSQDSTVAPAGIVKPFVSLCVLHQGVVKSVVSCLLSVIGGTLTWRNVFSKSNAFYLDGWHIFQVVPGEGANSVGWLPYRCIHKQSDVGKFRRSAPTAFNSVSNWNVSMTSQEFRMLLSNVYDENRGIDLLSDRGFRQFYDWSPSDWCICFPLIWSCRMVW